MQNGKNLEANAGRNGARLVSVADHVAYASALGKGYGWALHPGGLYDDDGFTPETATGDPRRAEFRERDPYTLHAVRSMGAVLALDNDIHTANRDQRLSVAGKAERLAAVVPPHLQMIAKAGAALAAQAPALDVDDGTFYRVPPAGSDPEQIAHDREIRDNWRAMQPGERERLLGSITNGQEPRALLALKRSPVTLDPPHAQATIDEAWRASVDRAQPERAAEIKAARAAHQWATHTVRTAARYAATTSGMQPHQIAKALGDTDTVGVFDTQQSAAA